MDLAEAVVTPLIEQLVQATEKEVVTCINVGKDLRQLQFTMVNVQETLQQNEGRDCRSQSSLLLLRRLNEAMYDAEDIIDDILMRDQMEGGLGLGSNGQVRLPSCSFPSFFPDLSFRRRIGRRIRDLRAEIEEVLSKIREQPEMSSPPATEDPVSYVIQPTDFYPGIVCEDIVGLEDKTASLQNVLTKGSNRKIQDTVYAIVGIPGIGKTTLAKMVYDSLETDNHFDKRIWLCLGNESNASSVEIPHRVLKSFFEQFNEKYDENATNYPGVIEKLVMNKRLLVVLDNCWSSDVWQNFLRTPVRKAAEGSAVLMTTRNRQVAKDMRALEIFEPGLSTDNAWLLLHKEVFGNHREESVQLKRFGMEIVKKCKKVPLAIKAIAGVIRNKGAETESVWKGVCSDDIWNYKSLPDDIMPALLLSYLDLPYNLKLCFCLCSLFPKNFVFHHPGLVQHWIAEGFVPYGEDMDVKGTEYYKALISRNLLQPEASYFDGKGSTMHDIMHELGKHVSSQRFVRISTKTRHLYIVEKNLSEVREISREEAGYLRTLVLSKNPIRCIPQGYLEKLHHLRVLDLSYSLIGQLADSVGELVQLRLLNLSFTRLKTLPNSIQKLRCLQSLQLKGSKCLEELPGEVVELSCLTCLIIDTAKLRSMPVRLGKLRKLRRLHGFLVNEDTCNISDLENLSGLSELTLYNLERLTSSPEEVPRNVLLNKTNLTHLHLSCSRECKEQVPSANNIEQMIEKLHPPRECRTIHIDGYCGKAFPNWMTTLPFHDLEWLRLENCKFFEQLPPLGQLPRLKVLDIRGNSAVTKIGSDFFGNLKFPRLEELYLIGLEGLRKWHGIEGAFPCLKKLEIIKCRRLKNLPSGMYLPTSLRELIIEEADKIHEIKDHPSILKLRIRRISQLMKISNIPKVDFMKIRICSSLGNVTGLTSLKHLVLSDHKMEFLPEWLKSMTSLKRLDLEVNKRLLVRVYSERFGFDKFQHIQHVELRCCIEDRDKPRINQGRDAEDSQNIMQDTDLYVSYTEKPFSFLSNLNHDPSISNNAPSSSSVSLSI